MCSPGCGIGSESQTLAPKRSTRVSCFHKRQWFQQVGPSSTAIGLDLSTLSFWIPVMFPFNLQEVKLFAAGSTASKQWFRSIATRHAVHPQMAWPLNHSTRRLGDSETRRLGDSEAMGVVVEKRQWGAHDWQPLEVSFKLICYWVGSLDFNFLGNQEVFR